MLGEKRLLKKLQLIVLGLAVGGLLLPLPAMARRNNNNRGRMNATQLGRAALKGLLFGKGRVAQRLNIRSKINNRRVNRALGQFRENPGQKARGVRHRTSRDRLTQVSRDRKLQAAVRQNLAGRKLKRNINQSITKLVEGLGGDRFLRQLGTKINQGDRAGVRRLMARIQAQIDEIKARLKDQVLNAVALEIETIAVAVFVVIVFLIDFNFTPQSLNGALGQQQQINTLVNQFTGTF